MKDARKTITITTKKEEDVGRTVSESALEKFFIVRSGSKVPQRIVVLSFTH